MILFVETSGEKGGLALQKSAGEIFVTEWVKKSSHSEVITRQFSALMDQAGAAQKDLKKIAVNIGPGSFTGLRVGLSFAKSLGYLLKIPLLAYGTLEVLAEESETDGDVLVALPAIKGHFYSAGYRRSADKTEELLAPASRTEEEVGKIKGDFQNFIDGSLPAHQTEVRKVLRFYQRKSGNFKETSWEMLNPLYLRRSQAEEKLRSGLLKPIYGESESDLERKQRRK
jgi:tRNA threonylcarbamoyl adenosine modification protein YeaZ